MNQQSIISYIQYIADQLYPELQDISLCTQYAWWLVEKATGASRTQLLLEQLTSLTQQQHEQLNAWIEQIVVQHKPIAYILQEVPFGHLMIRVRPPVLIPRMETEEWVLQLIERIKRTGIKKFKMLDMCAGSGCIGLLIAATFRSATVYAVDICSDARTLIEENKKHLGITNLHIITSDLFDALSADMRFDLIVTNPPYISSTEYAALDACVRLWEHKHALTADDEGLALIKRIIAHAPAYLAQQSVFSGSSVPQLAIEIGYQQAKVVEDCMRTAGFATVGTERDAAGKDRLVSGSLIHVVDAKDAQ